MNPEGPSWEGLQLFDPGPVSTVEIQTKVLERPVWSENKADLVAKYLRYFVFITHHGTYIDAFAGPQTDKSEDAWTAKAVVESEPRWLRHFHFFDEDPVQVEKLEALRDANPERDINVYRGDSNVKLVEVLPAGSIAETEASFCLLDQRTFECGWNLCEHIAHLRVGDHKVEQFYFLANSWLPRAFAGVSTEEGEALVTRWFGHDGWRQLSGLQGHERAEVFIRKFRDLGYRSVKAWPIFEREEGAGAIMYYMLHATDHEEAPKLMYRAYMKAVDPPEPVDQLDLFLEDVDLS